MQSVRATVAFQTIVIRWLGHKAVAERLILRLEADLVINRMMTTLLLRRVARQG